MVKIYSIEGNIGSGKSTLIRLLKKANKDIIFVLEPVDEWETIQDAKGENILTKFYHNQKKYAFSFQIMAYISRLAKLKRTMKAYPYATIISERSILTDKNVFAKMLYDDKKIEEIDYIIYLKWFDEFIKDIPQDGFIYLEVAPEICFKRVQKRNRHGESIDISYLQRCHDYHTKWLRGSVKNVLYLKGNIDFKYNSQRIDEIYKKILSFTNFPEIIQDEFHNAKWLTGC